MGVSMAMGVPNRWMVYNGQNPVEMDDDWGIPMTSRQPQSICHVIYPFFGEAIHHKSMGESIRCILRITVENHQEFHQRIIIHQLVYPRKKCWMDISSV